MNRMNCNCWKKVQAIVEIATVVALVSIGAGIANAQNYAVQAKQSPIELAKQLNANADAALRDAESKWCSRFASFRDSERLGTLVERLVSYQQKFEMAGAFLGLTDSASQNARNAIREKIVDERSLVRQMKEFADELLLGLKNQDQVLMKAMGLSVYSNRALCSTSYDSTDWEGAFEPLVRTTVKISQNDLARTAAVFTGSNIASDAINDSARSAGVNPYKDGTTQDFLADLLVNLAVGFFADAATDVTPSIKKELSSQLEKVEHELLKGRSGLLTAISSATEQHKQARLRLVGTGSKGVSK